jgi:hypothetical protein
MELILKRTIPTDISTIGELSIGGKRICYILEDKDRFLNNSDDIHHIKAIKVPGKTAIPLGRYEIIITYSNRFKKPLPLLLNVPGFEGVRIHSGNIAANTEGCLLPGTHYSKDEVQFSRAAFVPLASTIEMELDLLKKVFITITR